MPATEVILTPQQRAGLTCKRDVSIPGFDAEWSGSPDPTDPDNFWIDDDTGERINAHTGERTPSHAA